MSLLDFKRRFALGRHRYMSIIPGESACFLPFSPILMRKKTLQNQKKKLINQAPAIMQIMSAKVKTWLIINNGRW